MNGANSGYIVLIPVTELRHLGDVTVTLQARAAELEAKRASGRSSPEDEAALAAVRNLLDGRAEIDSNGHEAAEAEPAMLLRLPEAARLLGLSLTTVRELVARRELPCVRIGTSVRIRRDELAQWVAGLSPDPRGGGW